MKTNFILFTLILTLAGCAPNHFYRLKTIKNELGTSNRQSVIEAVGKPEGGRTRTIASPQGVPVEEVTRFRARQTYVPKAGHMYIYREQTLYFHDGLLVGFAFISGSPDESTFFDEIKAKNIVPGETKKEVVIKLLGRPAGEMIAPMTCGGSARELVYKFTTGSESVWTRKAATITGPYPNNPGR